MSLFKKKQAVVPRRRLANDEKINQPAFSSDVFRRGRTMIGSTAGRLSNPNFSQNLDSTRTHTHHLSIHRRRIAGILAVIFVIVTILWLILANFTATVAISLSDSANLSKTADKSIYEKVIQDYFDANPLNRLNFILDIASLTTYVSNRLPEVQGIERQDVIARPGETDFKIKMRTPVAGWKINEKQYYVDAKGISFERNYYQNPTVQIVDKSGISPHTGTAIASKRFLGFVGRVVSLSKDSGYTVTQAILPINTTRELDVYVKEVSYYMKLSIDRSAGEQVEDMSRSIGYFVSHGQTPKYIDVRVSGKAFYRF